MVVVATNGSGTENNLYVRCSSVRRLKILTEINVCVDWGKYIYDASTMDYI